MELKVDKDTLENEPDSQFNIITMFDLLEHLSKPRDFFSQASKKLKDSGFVLMYTPNIHSFSFYFQKGHHNILLPYEHLCFYNQDSLEFLASRTGYSVASIEYYGLDIVDYLCMKGYEDGVEYNQNLKEIIPYIQALIDMENISNHMRVVFKKQ